MIASISRRASLYSFSSRIASVCASDSSKRLDSFTAASALPSDLRMIRIASSRSVEDDREALQDVDAALELRQLELEPAADGLLAEGQELAQHRRQIDAQRPGDLAVLRRDEAGQVDVEPALERRVLVEVGHHQRRVGAGLQLQHDADVVGRLVANVDQHRELLVDDHLGDPLDHRRLREAVGDRRDHDVLGAAAAARLGLPLAAQPDGPLPALVDLAQLLLAVDDLTAGREVGTLDVLQQVLGLEAAVVDHRHRRRADLGQVVRRDVGRHADGDAGASR